MPELPEVETVMRGLAPVMTGRRIKKLHQNRPDLRFPIPKDFVAVSEGQRILGLRRIAKYLLFDLEDGSRILSHLGMSGRMTIGVQSDSDLGQGRHDHIVFDLDDGGRIVFSDPRRFGMADLIRPGQQDQDHKLLAHLGPDPLGNGFHEDYLRSALKGRKTPMKAALLDQKIVAGLGNIYVCEALFRAGISPKRSSSTMGPARCAKLVPVIRDVLTEAIASGGSSLKDYRRADGELGYFQHGFRVYDREGEPCSNSDCGKPIKRLVQSGRSTFYCSACQR